MSLAPEGEPLRNAVKWISEERQYGQETDLNKLIQKASVKFDLSPRDAAFLERFFTEKPI